MMIEKLGTHARFSEALFSSLWTSIYNLYVAKHLHEQGDYSWSIIASFYASEHAINALLMSIAGPELFSKFYRVKKCKLQLWYDRKSPLSCLRPHNARADFLEGMLNNLKCEDAKIREWYEKLSKIMGKDKLESIGKNIRYLITAREIHNYVGLLTAHSWREDIRVEGEPLSKLLKDLSRNVLKVSEDIIRESIKALTNIIIKLIKDIFKFVHPGIALGHIVHAIEEYEQAKDILVKVGNSEINNELENFMQELKKLRKSILRKAGKDIKELAVKFRYYTRDFKEKMLIYKCIRDLEIKLRKEMST